MKYIPTVFAAALCAMPVLSAGPGASPVGGGLMDDILVPYDDSLVELPGETTRKPSVSRSAQLVDDSAADTWGTRGADDSSASEPSSGASSSSDKPQTARPSSASGGGSRPAASGGSRSFTSDGAYIPYSERYPEPEREKAEGEFDRSTFDPDFNPFKNNYKYKDTDYKPNNTRPEYEETRRKIKDLLGEVPKSMTDSKVEELIHNPAREATMEAPNTPDRWTRAPNGWFCDYDDAMEKAQVNGKAVAVFFHSSDNDNSRKFKTERMENTKFKNKMRGRLLVVYMDYPDNADTSKDKRNKDQVAHNRRIAEKFHVSTYPTLIFLDPSGSEIGRISELKTLTSFIENADKIVPRKEEKAKNTGFRIGGSLGAGESGAGFSSD